MSPERPHPAPDKVVTKEPYEVVDFETFLKRLLEEVERRRRAHG